MAKKAQAFTRAIRRFSDTNVIRIAQAEPMDDEPPATDFAWDFAEGVEVQLSADAKAEDARARLVRRYFQANGARCDIFRHPAIIAE